MDQLPAKAANCWAESLGGGFRGDALRPGKSTCWAIWREELAAFEVLKPRGDSLRSMGTIWHGRTMLHAEEGLWLAERGMLAVHPPPTSSTHSFTTAAVAVRPPPEKLHSPVDEGQQRADPNEQEWEKEETGATQKRAAEPASAPRSGVSTEYAASTVRPHTATEQAVAAQHVRYNNCRGAVSRSGSDGGESGDGSSASAQRPSTWSSSTPTLPSRTQSRSKSAGSSTEATSTVAAEKVGILQAIREMTREEHPPVRGLGGRSTPEGGRRGAKRARVGAGEGTPPCLSIGALYHILSQAGVPWECYRAYAVLKQRSYVLRRRPEDTLGHDGSAPRAAPLCWFGKPAVTARHTSAGRRGGDTTTTTNNDDDDDDHDYDVDANESSFLPLTFHVYNPNAAFRKRSPGMPDSLLAVCRYEEPVPTHDVLVALARRHAYLKQHWGAEGVRALGEVYGGDGGRDTVGSGGRREGEGESGDVSARSLLGRGGAGGVGAGSTGGRALSCEEEVPGVKLAVVSRDGGVHLFDVGLHEVRDVVERRTELSSTSTPLSL